MVQCSAMDLLIIKKEVGERQIQSAFIAMFLCLAWLVLIANIDTYTVNNYMHRYSVCSQTGTVPIAQTVDAYFFVPITHTLTVLCLCSHCPNTGHGCISIFVLIPQILEHILRSHAIG